MKIELFLTSFPIKQHKQFLTLQLIHIESSTEMFLVMRILPYGLLSTVSREKSSTATHVRTQWDPVLTNSKNVLELLF